MKRALIVIAFDRYQDKEYEGTVAGLIEAGFGVTVASTQVGNASGKFGGSVEATIALSDVDVGDYDRIAFIGGPGACALKDDEDAKRIARDAVAAGMVLGAICIAPTILAAAGVLQGKRATVWNEDGEQDAFLASHGATYTGEDVTVDGMIVTANGPEAAVAFGKRLATL